MRTFFVNVNEKFRPVINYLTFGTRPTSTLCHIFFQIYNVHNLYDNIMYVKEYTYMVIECIYTSNYHLSM